MDIYREIWETDQENAGLEPLTQDEPGDADRGYVRVNTRELDSGNPDMRVMPDVRIPRAKAPSYDLCRKLFNNYALPEAAREFDTQEERTERHRFLEAIEDTPPMRVARDYISARIGEQISVERWHNTLVEMWFRRFSQGGDPELSGFEHVIVGEQEGGKVQGYHFWYKYYLDDGFADLVADGLTVPNMARDQIVYLSNKAKDDDQNHFPESVTISFRWNAPDYDAGAIRPLHKRIGGFFVGCSVEGLMAIGTVRAHIGADAPRETVIGGARYQLKLFHSSNNAHIRTFYPVFQGAADPVTDRDPIMPMPVPGPGPRPTPHPAPQAGGLRIIAALVNPIGHDPGAEVVTVVNATREALSLDGWHIVDKNGKKDALDGLRLVPGVPHAVILSGDGAQLGNKGGTIAVTDDAERMVHRVRYTRAQAKRENQTLLFP